MSRARKNARNNVKSFETQPNYNPNKINYTTKTGIRKEVRIIPRNIHQEEYLEYLLDPEKMIILAHGPAGSGKTTLAMLAAIKALSEKIVKKIILCRPAIAIDNESHGFLPGTIEEKMAPWLIPLFDILFEYYSKKEIDFMVENKIVEVTPLAFMRGRNLKNCFVILDESQNASLSQVKTVMTRLCDGSKLIITGDNDQSDRKTGENGLLFFKNALEKYGENKYISSIEFDHSDIERHPVVGVVLDIFDMATN
jgi:phosphate starvation-inducible PhoH-like protein